VVVVKDQGSFWQMRSIDEGVVFTSAVGINRYLDCRLGVLVIDRDPVLLCLASINPLAPTIFLADIWWWYGGV
jgi:hypothetical protein